MYQVEKKTLDEPPSSEDQIEHYQIRFNSRLLSYAEAIELWQTNQDFVKFFTGVLANCQFEKFYWETPPINYENKDQVFQFVCVNASNLKNRRPDIESFKQHLPHPDSVNPVSTFENLGADATLVAPLGISENEKYIDIAIYSRQVEIAQQINLWQAVSSVLLSKISKETIWLNTAGDGVAWLHIRLDSRPKYYSYKPFQQL